MAMPSHNQALDGVEWYDLNVEKTSFSNIISCLIAAVFHEPM